MSKQQAIKIKSIQLNESQLEIIKVALGSYGKYTTLFTAFFQTENIMDFSDIDFATRQKFITWLTKTEYSHKIKAVLLSCFDNIKLEFIKSRSHIKNAVTVDNTFFQSKEVFLLYYPDYSVAKAYKKVHDKVGLLYWDFSEVKPELSRQIKQTIIYLTANFSVKERSQKFLLLKKLMRFCQAKKITDIGQFTASEKKQFELLINNDEALWDKGSIVDLSIFAVELSESRFDFGKNLWFFEALKIADIRRNDARPIKSFDFMAIENEKNRNYCKEYIRYLIGITDEALSSIRNSYGFIREMAVWFSERDIDLMEVGEAQMDEYLLWLGEQGSISDLTYNRKVSAIKAFYSYMAFKHKVDRNIMRAFYYKTVYPAHLERIVEDETIREILKYLPRESPRLAIMYKVQLETGIRINEVCTLKGNCVDTAGWLTVYQPKMKTEKMIPISDVLEAELKGYISQNNIAHDGYVFRNSKGKAYNANTYSVRMVRFCEKYGISCKSWVFRSHDYRHHIATALHEADASINVIRDFLGHKSEEMTKQYIDGMDNEIAKGQEEYFEMRDKDDFA